tara:strand:- start:13929 stop:14096 length:168 start_codon:yes stop_codon:yes gene_type:complete
VKRVDKAKKIQANGIEKGTLKPFGIVSDAFGDLSPKRKKNCALIFALNTIRAHAL